VPLSVVSVARTQGLEVGSLRSCWVVKDHSSEFIGRKGVYMLSLHTHVWDVVVAFDSSSSASSSGACCFEGSTP
jgi:hypothetical protein